MLVLPRGDLGRWAAGEYAWLHIEPIPGGAATYFKAMDERLQKREALIESCFSTSHWWYFRRPTGPGDTAAICRCLQLAAGH